MPRQSNKDGCDNIFSYLRRVMFGSADSYIRAEPTKNRTKRKNRVYDREKKEIREKKED